MKLFVDDVREAPDDSWTVARTVAVAKRYLATGEVIFVSLDHDMGACADCTASGAHVGDQRPPETTYVNWCQHADDGYALVMWMIENRHIPQLVHVHSMNPVGKARMIAALESRQRHQTPEAVPVPQGVRLSRGGLTREEGHEDED